MSLPQFEPPDRTRVVYTDLDGTMLGSNGAFTLDPGGRPTMEPPRALIAALTAGIDVMPCSGRTLRGLIGDARILGLENVIAEMGAVLAYGRGSQVIRNLGDYPGGEEIPTEYMDRTGAVRFLLERFRLEHHGRWAEGREYTHLFRGLVDTAEAGEALAKRGLGWLSLQDNGRLRGAYLGLDTGEAHVYHLVPRGVSKAGAVALDRERRAVPREETIAIGDAVADLQIADHVGLLVLTRDSVEGDEHLAEAAEAYKNVAVTARPGNLGWADTVSALARH